MFLLEAFVYLGIIAAGISGALVGIKKQLDLFGVLTLCVATALGGGVIRDVMIGNLPPVAFVKPSYFMVSTIAGLSTWLYYQKVSRLQHIIMISDAIGLGVFTAIGAYTATNHHLNEPFLIISMGLITGIGGGVIRDLFAQEIPYVFRKEIYAIASILGATVYLFAEKVFPPVLALYICLITTFVIRVLSVVYKINFPVYRVEQQVQQVEK